MGVATAVGTFFVGTTEVRYSANVQAADQTAAQTWATAVRAWLAANTTSFTVTFFYQSSTVELT